MQIKYGNRGPEFVRMIVDAPGQLTPEEWDAAHRRAVHAAVEQTKHRLIGAAGIVALLAVAATIVFGIWQVTITNVEKQKVLVEKAEACKGLGSASQITLCLKDI